MAGRGKTGFAIGRGKVGGKGVAVPASGTRGLASKRHRKIIKDTIRGITKPDIRRLARRGGVKRISAAIYDDAREAMKSHMTLILSDCAIFLDHAQRKTVTVGDVIFALKRMGRPIYGFGEGYLRNTHTKQKKVIIDE